MGEGGTFNSVGEKRRELYFNNGFCFILLFIPFLKLSFIFGLSQSSFMQGILDMFTDPKRLDALNQFFTYVKSKCTLEE